MTSFSKWADDLADSIRTKEQKNAPSIETQGQTGADGQTDDELLKMARMTVNSAFGNLTEDARSGLANSLCGMLHGYQLLMGNEKPVMTKLTNRRLGVEYEILIQSARHRRRYVRIIDRINWKFIPE